MAYVDIGSKVIQAYLHGLASRQKQDQEEAELKARIEAQKAQQEQAKASLDERKRQFDASHAIAKVTADFQHQQALSNMQRNAAETGLTPPGSTVSEEVQGPSDLEAFNRALDLNNQPIPGAQGPQLRRTFNLPNEMGSFQAPDPISHAINQARLADIGNQPKVKAAIDVATGTEKAKQPGRIELETLKASDALRKQEAELAAKKAIADAHDAALQKRGAAHDIAMIQAANVRAAKSGQLRNRYLTAEEADKMGLPLGTTIEDAAGKPVIKKLDATSQKKFDTLTDLSKLTDKIERLGLESNFSALGKFGTGTLKSIVSSQTEGGSDAERAFRSELGNFDGIISELRAGKVITENEEKRLRRYIPQLNSSKADFLSKLKTFGETLADMQGTLLQPAARRGTSPGNSSRVDALLKKHGVK